MKTLAVLALGAAVLVPTAVSAEYMCDKRWAEKYGASCPAGSSWDSSAHICVKG